MRCPVCNVYVGFLANSCPDCNSMWEDNQQNCPALLDFNGQEVKCFLSFRHLQGGVNNNKKHRGYLEGPPRITFLWDYDTRESKTARTQTT